MRLTIGLAAMASLCLLAGCNRGAANNSANAPAPAANVTEPAANAPAPAPGANRENEIAECSADMSRRLAPGSDVAGFCNCAVDRILGGARQNEAMEQCAAQLHITLPAGEGAEGGAAPAGNTAE
jgi:hypothetical protein